MPYREHTSGFTIDSPLPIENAPDDPTSGDMWWAAYSLENEVYAAYKLLTRPQFPDDPTYQLTEKLKTSKYWDRYRDNFIGVGSDAEFNYIASKIDDEEKLRENLIASGWGGIAAGIVMGVLSPTMFIPIYAGGRGAIAVARGAALGLAATTAQEVPLQAYQETRTLLESGTAIGAGTILGGILGGAASMMTKEALADAERGLAVSLGERAILRAQPAAAGAQVTMQDAGGLARGALGNNFAVWMNKLFDSNPITRSHVSRGLTQDDFVSVRVGVQNLADAGYTMERNYEFIPHAEGGTAETNITVRHGVYADWIPDFEQAYANYVFDGAPPAFAANTRARLRALMDAEKLSRPQFGQEVFLAMVRAGEHQNQYIKKSAEAAARKILEPMLKDGQAAGVFPEKLPASADPGYILRMPNHEVIRSKQQAFIDFLAEHYNNFMRDDFRQKWQKVTERNLQDEQFLKDAQLKKEEIDKLQESIKAEQDSILQAMQDQHFTALADTIAENRLIARRIMRTKGGPKLEDETYAKQLQRDANDMEKNAGEEYAKLQTRAKGLDRRLKNLEQASVVVEAKLAKKLAKVNALEGQSEKALMRVARKGKEIFDELENWSDEKLDAELAKFRTQFERTAELYDEGEEKLAKIVEGDEPLLMPAGMGETTGGPGPRFTPAGLAEKRQEFAARLVASDLSPTLRKLVEAGDWEGFDKAYSKWISGRKTTPKAAAIVDEMKADLRQFESDVIERGLVAQGEEFQQTRRFNRLSNLSEKIEDAEDLGRPALREMIVDMLKEFNTRIRVLNDRRALRNERLRQQAATLTPEAQEARLAAVRERMKKRIDDVDAEVTKTGARLHITDGRPEVDFMKVAREMAVATKDQFMGTMLRLPTVDMMQDKRGSALARSLANIPTEKFIEGGWIETNIEKVLRTYIRTMAPDIEIAKRFGSPGASKLWDNMKDELHARQEALKTEVAIDKKGNVIKDANGKEKLRFDTKEKLEAETRRLSDSMEAYTRGLEVIVRRLRNMDGLPKDPNGMSYRMAQVAADLNVLRYMGAVTIASIPDLARPIMRYGLLRVFKDAWIPFITNLQAFKMIKREAMQAGVGTEAYFATRAHALLDVFDDLGRGTKLERSLKYLSSRQGIIALFSYWTDYMKYISAATANSKLMDSIGEVMTNPNASGKVKAFLAQNGINDARAQAIWKEVVENGGAKKVNGVWLPQTSAWKDDFAKQSYRAALAREVNNTITTPGVERPEWTTATPIGRLIAQFKSFGFSSTHKTLGAGLQQRDTNFLQGTLAAMALGALSYYLNSVARGGNAEKEMRAASPERWVDESLQRSGLMAAFGFVQDFMSRIPAVGPYVTLSGERTTRRGGSDILDTSFGPTFDLLQKAAVVLTGIDDPTQATAHAARQLLPFQNVFYLTQILDAIEASLNLPERRQ